MSDNVNTSPLGIERTERIAGDEAINNKLAIVTAELQNTQTSVTTEVVHRSEGDLVVQRILEGYIKDLLDGKADDFERYIEFQNSQNLNYADVRNFVSSIRTSLADEIRNLSNKLMDNLQANDARYNKLVSDVGRYREILSDITLDSNQITLDNGELRAGAWTILSQAREWDLEIISRLNGLTASVGDSLKDAVEELQNQLPSTEATISKAIEELSKSPIIKNLTDLLNQSIENDTAYANEMVEQAQQHARDMLQLAEDLRAEAQARAASVEAFVEGEVTTRIQEINKEVSARKEAINLLTEDMLERADEAKATFQADMAVLVGRITSAEDGLSTEIQHRKDGDSSTLTELRTYKISNDNAVTGMSTSLLNNINSTDANSALITGLTSRMNTAEAGIASATTTAADALTKATTSVDANSALATRVDALSATLTELEGSSVDANAFNTLKAEVTNTKGEVASLVEEVSSLESKYTTVSNDIVSQGAAISTLNLKMTDAEGKVSQSANDITLLKTDISSINSSLATKADSQALSQLSSDVTELDGKYTTQAGLVTDLRGSLDTTNINVSNAASAAQNALNTAGSKGKVIFGSDQPGVGDRLSQNLWIDTTGGSNTPKRWNGASWVVVTDKVAADALSAANAASALANTKADSSALSTLDSKVDSVDGKVTSNAANITTLQGKVSTVENGLSTKAEAEALSSLTTRVSNTEGSITSQGTRVTNLENSVNHETTGLNSKASSSALTSLDNKVTLVDDKVSVTNSSLLSLEGRVATTENGIASKLDASVINNYYTKVQADQAIAGQITTFESTLALGGGWMDIGREGAQPTIESGAGTIEVIERALNHFKITAMSNGLFSAYIGYCNNSSAIPVGTPYVMTVKVRASRANLYDRVYSRFNQYTSESYVYGWNATSDWVTLTAKGVTNTGNFSSTDNIIGANVPNAIAGDWVEFKDCRISVNSDSVTAANSQAIRNTETAIATVDGRVNAQATDILNLNSSLTNLNNTKLDASIIANYYTKGQADDKATEVVSGKLEAFKASLNVGGVNMLSDSDKSGSPVILRSPATHYSQYKVPADPEYVNTPITQDTQVTLTIWYLEHSEGFGTSQPFTSVTVGNTSTGDGWSARLFRHNVKITKEGKYHKCSGVVTIPAGGMLLNSGGIIFILEDNAQTTGMQLVRAQLEYGNVATAWSPSKATVNNKIDANSTAIQNINAEVTRVDGVATVANNATTTLAGRVSAVEGSVETKADVSALNSLTTRVGSVEGGIASQANQLINLSAKLNERKMYQLYSGGLAATTGGAGWIRGFDPDSYRYIGRSYGLVVFNGDGSIQSVNSYDVFGGHTQGFIDAVSAVPIGTYVAVLTSDEPQSNNFHIKEALKSLGGSDAVDQLVYRGAYLLVGRKGLPSGQAIEKVSNTGSFGVDYLLEMYNGVPIGLGGSSPQSSIISNMRTEVQEVNGRVSSLSQQTTTLATTVDQNVSKLVVQGNSIDGIKAEYFIKTDVNGLVAGYGLVNGGATSAFAVSAEAFFVGSPNNSKKPFMVLSSTQTINGVSYPAGTWIDTALIANATIGTAHIADASIVDAKIANLSASKITAGIISADRIGANSISVEKLMVGDTTNLWGNQHFNPNGPLLAGSRTRIVTDMPELKGNGMQLWGRDHYASYSTKIPLKAGDTFVIEYIAGRNGGPDIPLNVGLWTYNINGNGGNSPWQHGQAEQIANLGNGWFRWRRVFVVTNAGHTLPVAYGVLYFMIEQAAEEPNPAYWSVGDVTVRKGVGGELIVNGAITADKLSAAAIDTIALKAQNVTVLKDTSKPDGTRLVMLNGLITVYDDNNKVRVKLGLW